MPSTSLQVLKSRNNSEIMNDNPLIATFLGHFAILIGIGCFLFLLPSKAELDQFANTAGKASENAIEQIALLGSTIDDFQQPNIQTSIDNAGLQAKAVAEVLKGQSIDKETVQVLHDAFGDLADGLEKTGDFIDPENALAMATALEDAAEKLETSVVPNADEIANKIEEGVKSFDSMTKHLNRIAESSRSGFNNSQQLLSSITSIRNLLKDIEDVILVLETISGSSYPLVNAVADGAHTLANDTRLPGFPNKSYLPQGVTKNALLVSTQGKALAKELHYFKTKKFPDIRTNLRETRKGMALAEASLKNGLEHRVDIEQFLAHVCQQLEYLSKEYPRLALQFATVVRDTSKVKAIAATLRASGKRIRTASTELPKIQASISRGTKLLANSQQQLQHVIENRDKYDVALKQTVVTLEGLSVAIPATKSQIDQRLQEQKRILDGFEVTARQTDKMISAYHSSLQYTFKLLRLLLFAAIAITIGSFFLRLRGRSAPTLDHN